MTGFWDVPGPDKIWQLLILGSAEALGSAILLFIGCSAALPLNSTEPSLLYIAIAFGFAITIAVMVCASLNLSYKNYSKYC